MKLIVLIALIALVSNSAMAAPASSFSCSGTDEYYNVPVEFDIDFGDWTLEAGYDLQQITISSYDGKPTNTIIDLKETVLPNCTAQQSANTLDLNTNATGEWQADFLRACDAEVEYQLTAKCHKNY